MLTMFSVTILHQVLDDTTAAPAFVSSNTIHIVKNDGRRWGTFWLEHCIHIQPSCKGNREWQASQVW